MRTLCPFQTGPCLLTCSINGPCSFERPMDTLEPAVDECFRTKMGYPYIRTGHIDAVSNKSFAWDLEPRTTLGTPVRTRRWHSSRDDLRGGESQNKIDEK